MGCNQQLNLVSALPHLLLSTLLSSPSAQCQGCKRNSQPATEKGLKDSSYAQGGAQAFLRSAGRCGLMGRGEPEQGEDSLEIPVASESAWLCYVFVLMRFSRTNNSPWTQGSIRDLCKQTVWKF